LKREEAFYYKNLLLSGFSDGYDEWLNNYLETEEPLSDVVLELSLCGSDVEKTISVLHNFCAEQEFDEAAVSDNLRLFFKGAYYSGRMGKEEVINNMYQLAENIGDPGSFDSALWGSMYYLKYYHSLAKEGVILMERFDFAFYSYLDNGIPIDTELIWGRKKKQLLFDRFKSIFKRK